MRVVSHEELKTMTNEQMYAVAREWRLALEAEIAALPAPAPLPYGDESDGYIKLIHDGHVMQYVYAEGEPMYAELANDRSNWLVLYAGEVYEVAQFPDWDNFEYDYDVWHLDLDSVDAVAYTHIDGLHS